MAAVEAWGYRSGGIGYDGAVEGSGGGRSTVAIAGV